MSNADRLRRGRDYVQRYHDDMHSRAGEPEDYDFSDLIADLLHAYVANGRYYGDIIDASVSTFLGDMEEEGRSPA